MRDVCWFLDVIEIKDMVKGKANCILSELFGDLVRGILLVKDLDEGFCLNGVM